jgi:16S rRNA G1207 methylase RsmC
VSFTEAQIEAARAVIYELAGMRFADKTIRAALEAAERAAWRPVSEAPKDGTPVLVVGAENRPDKMDVAEWHYYCTAEGPYYCWATEGVFSMEPLDPPPTHFRPLPAPPEGTPA